MRRNLDYHVDATSRSKVSGASHECHASNVSNTRDVFGAHEERKVCMHNKTSHDNIIGYFAILFGLTLSYPTIMNYLNASHIHVLCVDICNTLAHTNKTEQSYIFIVIYIHFIFYITLRHANTTYMLRNQAAQTNIRDSIVFPMLCSI